MLSTQKNRYAKVISVGFVGLEPRILEIECHQSVQLPNFQVVGMRSREAHALYERVRAALFSCGHRLPSRKITVNLSPTTLDFFSEELDLPVALACLCAEGVISAKKLQNILLLGGLGLDGSVKRVRSANSLTFFLQKNSLRGGILPLENSFFLKEEQLKHGGGFSHLKEVLHFLQGGGDGKKSTLPRAPENIFSSAGFEHIRALWPVKQALLLAAAGSHHCLLLGPPGVGKSMLCAAYPGILPPLEEKEREEVQAIYEFAGLEAPSARPFRLPHGSITKRALLGGIGQVVGELSLAHRGVLFLDEILEMDKSVLETLRVPMESGEIHLARANMQMKLPARVQLLASANHCPCGQLGARRKICLCTPREVRQYQKKLSHALKDRIDIKISLYEQDQASSFGEIDGNSADFAKKASMARERMRLRQERPNAQLVGGEIFQVLPWQTKAKTLLEHYSREHDLSERSLVALGRLSLTIADLKQSEAVEEAMVLEAAHYRMEEGLPTK